MQPHLPKEQVVVLGLLALDHPQVVVLLVILERLVLLLLVELALIQGSIYLEWASVPLPIVWVRVLVVQAVLFLVFFISSSIYRAVKKQFHYSLFATELMVLAYYGVMLRPLGIVLI